MKITKEYVLGYYLKVLYKSGVKETYYIAKNNERELDSVFIQLANDKMKKIATMKTGSFVVNTNEGVVIIYIEDISRINYFINQCD